MELNFANTILRFFGFFVAIIVYQAVLIITAQKLGDRSSATAQRATLNPLPHIDILGTLVFPFMCILMNFIIVFGWAKPHQIETRYFKKPKRDVNVVYTVPVVALFFIAFLCLCISGVLMRFLPLFVSIENLEVFLQLCTAVGMSNMMIAALFLLPFPGTSGWFLLLNNVSYPVSQKIQSNQITFTLVFLVLLMLHVFDFYFKFFLFLFQKSFHLFTGIGI